MSNYIFNTSINNFCWGGRIVSDLDFVIRNCFNLQFAIIDIQILCTDIEIHFIICLMSINFKCNYSPWKRFYHCFIQPTRN